MRCSVAGAALLVAALLGGCDYARMADDEALQTHEVALPRVPAGTVPTAGGVEAVRRSDPGKLRSPLLPSAALRQRGRVAYDTFCVPCHGARGDGNGTVGQSFAPLPTDLSSRRVQEQTDGALFTVISLGFRRHPPLADTMAEADRWAVIIYVRTLTDGAGR